MNEPINTNRNQFVYSVKEERENSEISIKDLIKSQMMNSLKNVDNDKHMRVHSYMFYDTTSIFSMQ